MLLGDRIRTLRKNKRVTQAQLAEALSVSAQSVSKWETHLSAPDIALLPAIARYFGITMDELFCYRLDALNRREQFIRFMADKGIFVLVKTSNASSGELQDALTPEGITVSQIIAQYVAAQADASLGERGYSAIGAVVGATYPHEAASLRRIMPRSIFLVPGYGAQGGSAGDILPCFHADGLGAVVNSSRGVLFAPMSDAAVRAAPAGSTCPWCVTPPCRCSRISMQP